MKFKKRFSDDKAGWFFFADGEDFMEKAVRYNARLAGADAVIVLERKWHRDDETFSKSGSWSGGYEPPRKGEPTRESEARFFNSSPRVYTPGDPYIVPFFTYFYTVEMIAFND